MNIPEAAAVLRTLAFVAVVPNADAVSIKLSPYKGPGERSYNKGHRVAEAVGWMHPARRFENIEGEGRDDAEAIDELTKYARRLADASLETAKREADKLIESAQVATAKAAKVVLDADVRRQMLASLDAPTQTRSTHYAIVEFVGNDVTRAKVLAVQAYSDGRYDDDVRSVTTYSLRSVVNVPSDTRVGSIIVARSRG